VVTDNVDPQLKLTKWALVIQQYYLIMHYTARKHNVDGLSRACACACIKMLNCCYW